MGEIKDKVYNVFTIDEEDIDTFGALIGLCQIYSEVDNCRNEIKDNNCPFWKEHVGCLFRQGKVPREW